MTIQASVKSSCLATGTAALISFACVVPMASAAPPIQFGEVFTGSNSLYHQQPAGTFKQDLSGSATDGKYIIFVDDGGSPPDFSFVRVMTDLPDTNAINIPLLPIHKDLEGATFHKNYFVITTSLSSDDNNPPPVEQRLLTRFKLNAGGTALIDQTSVDLRIQLLEAMRQNFGDEWFDRIKSQPGRAGGLNIEGISTPRTGQDFILWGIRSPLYSDNFGNPATTPGLSLAEGVAIIAKVHKPFSGNPTFDFQTVHLPASNVPMNDDTDDHIGHDDHGIRGIEWIPKLHGYVIIGGPIPAADNYSLWRLRPNGEVDPIELPEFSLMCRPESVIQMNENGKDYLVILSEQSSTCANVTPTFLMAEILP